MAFNFGGFIGGLSEGIYEGIEKEEERINMLADKAWDQYTQDYRANKAKKEAAKEAAMKAIGTLTSEGYNLETAAHIARYGDNAVKSAIQKANDYAGIYDLNTLYNVAPDPSTKDFQEEDWVKMIVGTGSTVDPNAYLGPAGDYKGLFTGSARDIFNDRVKASNMREAIPTQDARFGTMNAMQLSSKEVKTYNSYESLLVGLTQKIAKEKNPDTVAALEEQYKNAMSNYIEFKNSLEKEGKAAQPFSKESISSIIRERRRAMFSGNIVKSIGEEIQLTISGNENEYISGMDLILDNLTKEFVGEGKINDPLMNARIESEKRNLEKVKINYVRNLKANSLSTQDSTEGARYLDQKIEVPVGVKTAEFIQKTISEGDYRAGDVITYKVPKIVYEDKKPVVKGYVEKILIYTGIQILGVDTSLLTSM